LKNRFLKSRFLFILIFTCLVPNLFAQPKLISLDFKSTDIKDVLRALASQEGVNLVVDNDISRNVTIQLNKVTFQQALNLLAAHNDLTYTQTGNLYRVSRVDHSFLTLEYSEGLLSMEAREVKLDRLIRELAAKTGANLVPAPDLTGKITLSLRKVALNEAVQAILTQGNCTVETVGPVGFVREKSTPAVSFTVNYTNNRLTVDAKEVPIAALCRAITEKSGVAVVPDQNFAVNVTIFIQNVLVDEGLTVLCDSNGLQLYKEGEIRRIAKKNGSYRIGFKEGLLSVDADNVAIATLTHEISRQSGTMITLDRDVRANVSAHFQDLSLAQGLVTLTNNQGWIVDKQSHQYYIRPNANSNKNIRVTYNPDQERFDLDIQSGSLDAVISEMARRANVEIVVSGQMNTVVSNIRLQQLKFEEALEFLFTGTNYFYKKMDNVYLIGEVAQVRPENKDFNLVKVYPVQYIKAEQILNSMPATIPRQNFTLIPERNALVLTAPPTVHDLFSDYLKQVDAASNEDRTEVIKVKYMKAEDMLKLIPASLPKSDLVVVKEANAIAVTGPQNIVSQIKNYIDKLDQVNPMIVFDITVIQISDTNNATWDASGIVTVLDGKELNVSVGEYALNKAGANTGKAIASLTALISKGQAKVVANPTITTLNGCQTNFNVSTKYNYTVPSTVSSDGKSITESVKTYDSGLYFTILPWVSVNKQITMEIKPKISEFGDAPKGSTLPSTMERSTETTIRVNDGQTVIISGLKYNRKQVSDAKVPVLGDLPLIKYLFKSKKTVETQDEYVLVIKPTLVFDPVGQDRVNREVKEGMGPEMKEMLP
jgi:type II secretory pathway component GspD/PulD (secretin)